MKTEDINRFFAHQFAEEASSPIMEGVDGERIRARLPYAKRHLRPGGTISGPAMMMLADAVGFMAVMAGADHGIAGVTSNLNIHFLSRPQPGDLLAYGEVLRMGRRQAVVAVSIHTEAQSEPVASATVTYALPHVGD